MSWFRLHRRRFAGLSALIVALQALAVMAASQAHATAAQAEGSDLVIICTAQGAKVIDLTNPDAEPAPVGGHQCPLCIVGCAGCGTPPIDPALLTDVIGVLLPAASHAVPVLVATPLSAPRHIASSTSPRGPPALA